MGASESLLHAARVSVHNPAIRFSDGRPEDAAAEARAKAELLARLFGRKSSMDRYHLIRRIGAGGAGQVYEAWDCELHRRVAVKVLHPRAELGLEESQARARILREAKAVARLSHPNVVAVFDVGDCTPAMARTIGTSAESAVFIVMEYVEGPTLRAWIARERPSWREVVEVFGDAARGLAGAHAQGIVHRDFKPSNAIVGDDSRSAFGRVRVLDFGLARSIELEDHPSESDDSTDIDCLVLEELTQRGIVMGTPRYMAPEQHRGEAADARSDQFAFAVALCEALYGQRPFRGDTMRDLAMAKHRACTKLPHAGVPRWLERVLLRALAPAREDRWPSMLHLSEELTRGLRRQRCWMRTGAVAASGALAVGLVAWVAAPADPTAIARTFMIAPEVPEDSQLAAEVGVIERLRAHGDLPVALARADALVERARLSDDASALGRGLVLRASIADGRGDPVAAEGDLRAAFFVALAAGDELVAIDAAIGMVRMRGELQADEIGAAAWREHAESTLTRVADPIREARLLDAVGQTQLAKGDADAAATTHGRALEIRRRVLRADDPELASSRHNLALAELRRGEPQRAHALLTSAHAAFTRAHGAAHLRTVTAALNLATVEDELGRADIAEEHYRGVISALADAAHPNDSLRAVAHHNLAASLAQGGRTHDAEVEAWRAYELWLATFGEQHPDVAKALRLLGQLAVAHDDVEEGRALCERARAIEEMVLPREHPATRETLACIAGAHRRAGDLARAVAVYETALADAEAAGDDEAICHLANELGLTWRERGELRRAESECYRALEACVRHGGNDGPSSAPALESLGAIAADRQAFEAARTYYRRARLVLGAQYGHASPVLIRIDDALARIDEGPYRR